MLGANGGGGGGWGGCVQSPPPATAGAAAFAALGDPGARAASPRMRTRGVSAATARTRQL